MYDTYVCVCNINPLNCRFVVTCRGCITAALPFAIAANSPGDDDGSSNLAIAYEIGSFCLVSGDLTTTLFQLPYRYAVTLYTVFAVVIYVAAFNLPGFYSPAAAPFIVILYALTQYIEAHTLTAGNISLDLRII